MDLEQFSLRIALTGGAGTLNSKAHTKTAVTLKF